VHSLRRALFSEYHIAQLRIYVLRVLNVTIKEKIRVANSTDGCLSRDANKDAKLVEGRAAAYRLSRKWTILYKHISLAQHVFQVSIKHKIKHLSGSTDPFKTRKGRRLGDSLFCMLFNIAVEKVVREEIWIL
jgi:hypothetical protein